MAKSSNGPSISTSNPLDGIMSGDLPAHKVTRAAAIKVLRKVINAQKGKKLKTFTAAEFAVAFDVELRKAQKRGALNGYTAFLAEARDASKELVLRHDPDGGWLSGFGVLRTAYVALGGTTRPVEDAEMRYELARAARKQAKREAKRAAA